ncbi:hypothetical protein OIU34_21700 [Pararhizobium sp. BT-229]|nr:hypothetical protein [Pararhizobium sp. BT-229]MCV9964508.1 hypothetical protein [Pararhizobium sp. BT-229]
MPYRNLKNSDDIEFHKNGDTPHWGVLGWAVVASIVLAALAGLAKAF